MITNCIFDSNSTTDIAGDIATYGDTFYLFNCKLFNSYTNGSAGSIYIGAGYTSQIELKTIINNNIFNNINSINYGGAILHETSDLTYIKINNNIFTYCQSGYGPVINIFNQYNMDTFIFDNNLIDDSNYDIQILYYTISFPIELIATVNANDSYSVCPICVQTIESTAIDLFNQTWIPYIFCNLYSLNQKLCIQFILYNFDYLTSNDINFEIISQSLQFINGLGNESFLLYTLQYNKIINLTFTSEMESIKSVIVTLTVSKCDIHYSGVNLSNQYRFIYML